MILYYLYEVLLCHWNRKPLVLQRSILMQFKSSFVSLVCWVNKICLLIPRLGSSYRIHPKFRRPRPLGEATESMYAFLFWKLAAKRDREGGGFPCVDEDWSLYYSSMFHELQLDKQNKKRFMQIDWSPFLHPLGSRSQMRAIKIAVNWVESSTSSFRDAKAKLISRAMISFPNDLFSNERPMNISLIYDKCCLIIIKKTRGVIAVNTVRHLVSQL